MTRNKAFLSVAFALWHHCTTAQTGTSDADDDAIMNVTAAPEDAIECGQTVTGSLGHTPDSVSYIFVNDEVQDVTFTNCDSNFNPKLYLIDAAGNYIQDQSTDYRWYDASYCDTFARREIYTMEDLAVGTYTFILTPWYSGGDYSLEVYCDAFINGTDEPTTAGSRKTSGPTTSRSPVNSPSPAPSNPPTRVPSNSFQAMVEMDHFMSTEDISDLSSTDSFATTEMDEMTTWEEEVGFMTTEDDKIELVDVSWNPNVTLTECEGDCNSDDDCVSGLQCWQRVRTDGPPPGCTGTPTHTMDYCFDPTWNATHSPAPTIVPTWGPTEEPIMEPTLIEVGEALANVTFGVISTETFDNESMQIGWLRYSTCAEGNNPNEYNPEYSFDELLYLARYAITVKILPASDVPGHRETANYSVMANRCSNPVFALNHGKTMSWTLDENADPTRIIGLADTDNWIGNAVAKRLVRNVAYGNWALPTLRMGHIYHASGNDEGFHIFTGWWHGEHFCWFHRNKYIGHNISVWFGFDANKERNCECMYDSTYGKIAASPWYADLMDEIENEILDEVPTVALIAFGVLSVLACALLQCCCRKKKKSYAKVGLKDTMLSGTDTDSEAAQPMNL